MLMCGVYCVTLLMIYTCHVIWYVIKQHKIIKNITNDVGIYCNVNSVNQKHFTYSYTLFSN